MCCAGYLGPARVVPSPLRVAGDDPAPIVTARPWPSRAHTHFRVWSGGSERRPAEVAGRVAGALSAGSSAARREFLAVPVPTGDVTGNRGRRRLTGDERHRQSARRPR